MTDQARSLRTGAPTRPETDTSAIDIVFERIIRERSRVSPLRTFAEADRAFLLEWLDSERTRIKAGKITPEPGRGRLASEPIELGLERIVRRRDSESQLLTFAEADRRYLLGRLDEIRALALRPQAVKVGRAR